MTTSFARTREQFRDMVLDKLRVLGVDETATTADSNKVYEAMDLRLKELHKFGYLWRKVSGTVSQNLTLSSGVSTVAAPSDILLPIKVKVRDGSSDYPCDIIGHLGYAEIGNKSDTGTPTKIFLYGSTFYLWPVPSKDLTASLTYEKIIDDTAASTAPDVDVSFLRCLKVLVAYDLADTFHVDEARISRLTNEAIAAEMSLRKLNAPSVDNLPVQVDYF